MDLIALDEDDAIAIVTRKLIEEYPLFKGHRISVLKGKGVPVTDNKCFTNITTLYEVNDIILADERGRKWRDFKRFRPSDAKLSGLYEKATNFWDLMVLHFPSIADVQNSEEEIAGRYRDKNGGRLLFRTIGLLSMAKAIKTAVDSGDNLESWMQKFSNVPTDLASSPWIGLFWDSSEKVMIIRKENQTIGILLLLYMVGLDLTKINTSETRLKARYASALNRQEDEIQLPEKII